MNKLLVLGKVISRVRKLAKLSQKELADKLFMSDKTVSAYESCRVIPPVLTLQKIAEITRQPISVFFKVDDKNEASMTNLKLDTILEEIDKIKKYLNVD